MDFSKIIDWIKLPPRPLLGVALASATILFAPDQSASRLGLLEFRNEFRLWLGAIFVLTTSLFLVHVLDAGRKTAAQAISQWKATGTARDRLERLTPKEKVILRAYVENEMRTRYWLLEDGVVRGLEAASILYRATENPDWSQLGKYAFNVQDWAWKILMKKPELVEE